MRQGKNTILDSDLLENLRDIRELLFKHIAKPCEDTAATTCTIQPALDVVKELASVSGFGNTPQDEQNAKFVERSAKEFLEVRAAVAELDRFSADDHADIRDKIVALETAVSGHENFENFAATEYAEGQGPQCLALTGGRHVHGLFDRDAPGRIEAFRSSGRPALARVRDALIAKTQSLASIAGGGPDGGSWHAGYEEGTVDLSKFWAEAIEKVNAAAIEQASTEVGEAERWSKSHLPRASREPLGLGPRPHVSMRVLPNISWMPYVATWWLWSWLPPGSQPLSEVRALAQAICRGGRRGRTLAARCLAGRQRHSCHEVRPEGHAASARHKAGVPGREDHAKGREEAQRPHAGARAGIREGNGAARRSARAPCVVAADADSLAVSPCQAGHSLCACQHTYHPSRSPIKGQHVF